MMNENKEKDSPCQDVGKILETIQDEKFTNTIATKVYSQFAEVFLQIQSSLESLHKGQQKMASDWEGRFKLLGENVHELRDMIPTNFRDEFYQMKNKVNTLQSVSSKKAIKTRIVFTALAAIIITLLFVFMLLPWFHNHFLAEINYRSTDTIEWTKQLHEGQARDNGATRSIPMPKTDAERDTLINQQERAIKARK